MGFRSPPAWLTAFAVVFAILASCTAPSASASEPPAPGTWVRPVAGGVTRPFVEPRSRYGAGHRGVDLAAPAGAPVHAANAGEITFAGDVAGSLHVVVAHPGGLRTSYSFLAAVAVRRGQQVARGDVVGTAGGGNGDHAGVLHFGLRVGDRYVDPMALFTPTDLTRLIRLVPVDTPAQAGFDPPALEQRSLAESLHLPRAISGLTAPEPSSGPLDAIGDALSDAAELAGTLPVVSDGVTMARRLVAWVRSRADCTNAVAQPASGGGSGHLVVTVAGINSSTDPVTGTALALDAKRLGYRNGEVRSFSYAAGGGPYRREQTWGDLANAADALTDQLRALQRDHPGREVDLIAHSQGGVVVGAFLARYEPGDPTLPPLGTVVTLSSPLQGAPAATALARVRETATGRAVLDGVDRLAGGAVPPTSGTSTGQLAEQSSFMRGIKDRSLPEQIDLTSIGAVDDVIVPADHTVAPGARSITVDPSGLSDHSAIVRDPAALDATRLALEGGALPCVGVATGVAGAIEPVVISRVETTIGQVGNVVGHASDAALGKGGTP
ncbi:MAG: peptidoglycan DD-metalloendopeptidase family protein [Acidimicrobiia bacterium]